MTETTANEVRELRHFAELMLNEPCDLYAFHMRELANSIYYASKVDAVRKGAGK